MIIITQILLTNVNILRHSQKTELLSTHYKLILNRYRVSSKEYFNVNDKMEYV